MTVMDRAGAEKAEVEILRELRRVRLVFELGFPPDLVAKARDVVMSALEQRRLVSSSSLPSGTRVRYPASFVLHVVDLTKDRQGDKLWTSDELSHLVGPWGCGSDQKLANDVSDAIRSLKLETFETLIEAVGALRNITPVTMHSGLPVNNIGPLLRLIETANRRGRFVAEEQIKYWSSTRNGFHGLWVAPKRLLQESGAIGFELLERINDLLAHPDDPSSTGLPEYLIEAIEREAARTSFTRTGSRTQLPRPRLLLDPYSCRGPVIKLPIASNTSVARWRTTGTARAEYAASPHEVREVDLVVSPTYEVSAIDSDGSPLESRSFRAFSKVPVYFFDPSSGRLLEADRSRIDVNVRSVLALIHPKAKIDGGKVLDIPYPEPIGSWSGWKIVEYDISKANRLVITDRTRSDDQDDIVFRRGLSRPSLSEPSAVARRVRADGHPVYDIAPQLIVDLGATDPSLVSFVITSADGETTVSLSDVDRHEDRVDLDAYLGLDGRYTVEVRGPSGLSMRRQTFVLLRDLTITQTPSLALPGDEVALTRNVGADFKTVQVDSDDISNSIMTTVFGHELTVALDRLAWSLRLPNEDGAAFGGQAFRLAVDDLDRAGSAFLNVDSGLPQRFQLELRNGTERIHPIESSAQTSRWAVNLGQFLDDVRHAGAESIDVVARVSDGREIVVGTIAAEYVAAVTAQEVDANIAPAVIRLHLTENSSFKSRVARIWHLDRPWDDSFIVPIPDGASGVVDIVLPADHRRGNYRIWVRVEGPLALVPKLPNRDTRGVVDVHVESGTIIDTAEPEDRLISAVVDSNTRVLHEGDVATAGYVLIALLAQEIRDGKGRGLSTPRAGTIFRLLLHEPHAIITQVARALTRNVVSHEEALTVSLALMSVVFEAEDAHDLRITPDDADLVWSQLPWIGAAVEPWDDSTDARHRWSERLGWPLPLDGSSSDQEFDDVALPEISESRPPLRPILDADFERQARLFKDLEQEIIDGILDQVVGARTDLPLSVDAEWDAVMRNIIPLVGDSGATAVKSWALEHSTIIHGAVRRLDSHPYKDLLSQYSVRAMSPTATAQDRWFFHNVTALAVDFTTTRDRGEPIAAALIDACELSRQWVGYALLLALSIHPFSRLD